MWIISRREKGEKGEGRTECQVKTCSEFLMERTEREREREREEKVIKIQASFSLLNK
jgi:hypothetical protein